jgi:hypothetical protein
MPYEPKTEGQRAHMQREPAQPQAPEIFPQYQIASWAVGVYPVMKFPVMSISESGGNRLVERERPYRDGAKFDDTGSKAKRFTVKVCFNNTISEPDLPGDVALYPEVLLLMLDSFDQHMTGDLTLPTRGKLRARAESYTRDEAAEARDEAAVSFTFVQDNEDNIGAASFEEQTINANARRLAATTEFSAQSEGMWDTSLADLREFGSELEGIANYPGNTVRDVDSQSAIVMSTCRRTERGFSKANRDNESLLRDPELSQTQRKLDQNRDMAGRARNDARAGRPAMTTIVASGPTDLFTIAAQEGQDVGDLMDINPAIDATNIAAGTVIRIFV